MKDFEVLKNEISEACKENSACSGEFKKLISSQNHSQLLNVLVDNLSWSVSHKIINAESIEENFGKDLMLEHNILNSGVDNLGFSNTGYSSIGERNTGAFCTGEKTMKFFNKDSDWTENDFTNSKAWSLLAEVDTKRWIPEHKMTDEEKKEHIGWARAEGFFRNIPFKQAFQDKWNNWTTANHKVFFSLPNFDSVIFFEITGVKISE